MQRETEQRVREMQSRARLIGENEPGFQIYKNKNTKICPQENPLSSFFKNTDSDKLMIMALLWILWNEKADSKLLLALLYLLL